jgi:hypothetical protein
MTDPLGGGAKELDAEAEVLIRQEGVYACALPDQSILLFDEHKGIATPLNESGARVWQMCDGTHSVHQIVAHLIECYDGEPDQIDRDTRDFLAVLLRQGSLERVRGCA